MKLSADTLGAIDEALGDVAVTEPRLAELRHARASRTASPRRPPRPRGRECVHNTHKCHLGGQLRLRRVARRRASTASGWSRSWRQVTRTTT